MCQHVTLLGFDIVLVSKGCPGWSSVIEMLSCCGEGSNLTKANYVWARA